MKKSNKGFTLVELIVVIAVLALLAVLAVVAFAGVQRAAREEAAFNDASTIVRHLNLFNSVGPGGLSGGLTSLADDERVFSPEGVDMYVTLAMDASRLSYLLGTGLYNATVSWNDQESVFYAERVNP